MPRGKNKTQEVPSPPLCSVTPDSPTQFWIPLEIGGRQSDVQSNKSDDNDDIQFNAVKKPKQRSAPTRHQLIVKELQSLRTKAQEAQSALDTQISINERAYSRLSLLERVLLSGFPAKIQEWLISKVKEADTMTDGGSRMKLIQYVETALKLPLQVEIMNLAKNDTCITVQDLIKVRSSMTEKMYGQEYLKDEILSILARIVTAGTGSYIGFAGPPGIGKTMAARTLIAQSLEIPFYQISCGGLQDPSVLLGHSSTYVGAKPGQIAQFAIENRGHRAVLVLDEIDKIANDAIWGVLTHLLDKTQNSKFIDHYFGNEIPIDISKWIFVVTYNDRSKVNDIVCDRLKIVNIPDYTLDEKKQITSRHLLPDALKELHLLHHMPLHVEDIIAFIVQRGVATHSTGVRGIKQVCEALAVRYLLSLDCSGGVKTRARGRFDILDVKSLFEKEDYFLAQERRNSMFESMYT